MGRNKNSITQCRNGYEFKATVMATGRFVEVRQTGSHWQGEDKETKTRVVIPLHNRDMPNGTRQSLIKLFRSLGIAFLIFVTTGVVLSILLTLEV